MYVSPANVTGVKASMVSREKLDFSKKKRSCKTKYL